MPRAVPWPEVARELGTLGLYYDTRRRKWKSLPSITMREDAQLSVRSIWSSLRSWWTCCEISEIIGVVKLRDDRYLLASQVFRPISANR